MKNLLSKRSGIKPFLAIDMLTQANKLKSKGNDIIHMDVGEPGIKPSKKLLKHIQYEKVINTFNFYHKFIWINLSI